MEQQLVERVANLALALMAKTASNREPGERFTTEQVVAAVAADPTGPTARYLADLIVTGIKHHALFCSVFAAEGDGALVEVEQ